MNERWHGTLSGYTYHRCRCEGCAAAMREYGRRRPRRPVGKAEAAAKKRRQVVKRRAERQLIDGRLVHPRAPHGKYTGYSNWTCRCGPCAEAWNGFVGRQRLVRRVQRQPDANGFLVSTAPVRHGLETTYGNWGCQCRPCLDAHATYTRKRGRVAS